MYHIYLYLYLFNWLCKVQIYLHLENLNHIFWQVSPQLYEALFALEYNCFQRSASHTPLMLVSTIHSSHQVLLNLKCNENINVVNGLV